MKERERTRQARPTKKAFSCYGPAMISESDHDRSVLSMCSPSLDNRVAICPVCQTDIELDCRGVVLLLQRFKATVFIQKKILSPAECTRNRRLCTGVAPAPGTPPEDGAARRNPGDDGINMLVVLTAPSRHRSAFELSRASHSAAGPTHGRRQRRSPVMGRLRPSLLRHSTAHDRCVRFAERTSMAAHSSLAGGAAAGGTAC